MRSLPQVAEAMPVKLLMTTCESASDIIALHGVDKEKFLVFREYTVDDAALAEFRTVKDGALVGHRIAARYGWKRGQNVTLPQLKGVSFKVCGIFTTHGTADDFIVLVGRTYLQEVDDAQGISNMVLVKLDKGANADAVKTKIDGLPLTVSTDTQPEKAHLSTALDQLQDLVNVSKIVIGVIIFVILIAMGNAIAMTTRERTREFGILRTLGYGKSAILALVVGEGVLQTLAGGIAGCLVVEALLLADIVRSVSTCGLTVAFVSGPAVWFVGVGVIVLAGLAGSIMPALRAARLDIVSAIRRQD